MCASNWDPHPFMLCSCCILGGCTHTHTRAHERNGSLRQLALDGAGLGHAGCSRRRQASGQPEDHVPGNERRVRARGLHHALRRARLLDYYEYFRHTAEGDVRAATRAASLRMADAGGYAAGQPKDPPRGARCLLPRCSAA